MPYLGFTTQDRFDVRCEWGAQGVGALQGFPSSAEQLEGAIQVWQVGMYEEDAPHR
jgi:hypothetical protein